MVTKAEGVIGLARKAGMLAVGTNGVLDAVRSGKAVLVLIASDASENTKKLLFDKASFRSVPTEELPFGTEQLGRVVGKQNTAAAAFLSDGFLTAYRKATDPKNEPSR